MPPGSMQYTLAGFSAQLDWRPLTFLKPLPPNRVCSACGLVRPKTALLPCSHTLCESCYEQCAETGPHVCPLDGYECQDEEVIAMDFPADELVRREVKCWNERNGCEYVATASRIAQHFQLDCGHHSVICPKCSAAVPCCSVIAHLKYGFCSSVTPPASDGERQSGCRNAATTDSVSKEAFENQVGEVKDFLGQIVSDIKAHGDRLNEMSHALNSLKETQQHQVMVEAGEGHDSFSRIIYKMDASNEELKGVVATKTDTLNLSQSIKRLQKTLKAEMGKIASQTRDKLSETATAVEMTMVAGQETVQFSRRALDHIKSILRPPGDCNTLCMFLINDVKSLQQTAMMTDCTLYESEHVYLRGYNLSPSVYLVQEGESVNLYAGFRLYKGNMDDILHWPFHHDVRLGVLHPRRRADRVMEVEVDPSDSSLQRPTSCSNFRICFTEQSLNMEDLIRDGYVKNDQLRIMFELLP